MQIIPAILAHTEQEYQTKLGKIEGCEGLRGGYIQIDLMDGVFVSSRSIGVEVIKKYPTDMQIEAQLMVDDPQLWIKDLVKIGASRIVFPIEVGQTVALIDLVKSYDLEVGVSINPGTDIQSIQNYLDRIDLVLVMSVNPGFSGQTFIRTSFDKIRKLKKMGAKMVEVDGGIKHNIVGELILSGADSLVVGSHLVEGNIDENLENFWQVLHSK